MNTRRANTRDAFTLVEILTVVVIISILVTIIAVAVVAAQRASKRARIALEMNQVAMALEHYKAEFGEYPPDMFDDDALVRHVKKRWPRLLIASVRLNVPQTPPSTLTATQLEAWTIRQAISNTYSDICGNNVDFTQPGSEVGALVLWLGGFPNSDGKLSGFYADPENPFFVDPTVPLEDRRYDGKSFITLELGEGKKVRFMDFSSAGSPWSVPVIGSESRDGFVPVVYFRGRASGGANAYLFDNGSGVMTVKQIEIAPSDWVVPYAEEVDSGVVKKWRNPTTYQLIHAGLDGTFGDTKFIDTNPATIRVIGTDANLGVQDLDNLTNFSDYKELKSILP
jgi:prepilin-type N-terminal cleavage/methylation domain-containing protein